MMATLFTAFVITIAVSLAVTVRSIEAAATSAITVAAGGWVTLPVAGIVRADTNSTESAVVWAGTDAVTIYGIRPGTVTLALTTPGGIEARSVQIIAPAGLDMSLVPQFRRCPAAGYVKAAEPSHVALDAPDVAFDWTPAVWQLAWTPPEGRFLATSALVTPLQSLGVPAMPGVQAEWQTGWQLIVSNALGLIGYRVPNVGTVDVGNSTFGSVGLMEATLGGVNVSAAVLMPPTGPLVSSAQASVAVGTVNVGYAMGPAGGSATVQLRSGSVSATGSASPAQGVQVGLGLSLSPGLTVGSSWSSAGAWQANVAFSVGAGNGAPPPDTGMGLCGSVP